MPAPWWERSVVYQIYPRSFNDSDGDGVGDLPGITARLDYLCALGVNAVWLSPIYPSPMADFGYDVADYRGVDPLFGTLADADGLIAAAHARGLKLILDFVPNHSSDMHPWFRASRSGRDDPKRDWYIWRDPGADGREPNNWLAHFGGSAWEWDADSGQYYLHSFLKEQPDLNWRNPAVRAAMYAELRFWLERGVDGFRVDVLWMLVKDDAFRDNPPNPAYAPARGSYDRLLPVYTSDRPEIFEIVAEMRALLDGYGERVLIGEIYLPVERLMAYYGRDLTGAHLPFNFQLIDAPWNAGALAEIVRTYEAALPAGAWPNWVLGNHDKPRIASRVGAAQARVAAMLLLTLRGTPTMYYGDEIGMTDVAIAREAVRDPAEINQPGIGLGRDPERTPLPWDDSPAGGFTSGEPWLPLGDHASVNVAAQLADSASLLALYQRLTALRRSEPALFAGSIGAVLADGDRVLHFERSAGASRFSVVLNLRAEACEADCEPGSVMLSTAVARAAGETTGATLRLHADEGLIIKHAPAQAPGAALPG